MSRRWEIISAGLLIKLIITSSVIFIFYILYQEARYSAQLSRNWVGSERHHLWTVINTKPATREIQERTLRMCETPFLTSAISLM
jgi:hypothetical protein